MSANQALLQLAAAAKFQLMSLPRNTAISDETNNNQSTIKPNQKQRVKAKTFFEKIGSIVLQDTQLEQLDWLWAFHQDHLYGVMQAIEGRVSRVNIDDVIGRKQSLDVAEETVIIGYLKHSLIAFIVQIRKESQPKISVNDMSWLPLSMLLQICEDLRKQVLESAKKINFIGNSPYTFTILSSVLGVMKRDQCSRSNHCNENA